MSFIRFPVATILMALVQTCWCGEFRPLCGGAGPEGWKGDVENYVFSEGVIRCREGKGGVVFTEEEYRNFVLCFEFKLPPGGNNGLAIRYSGTGDPAYTGMCELQVLDNTAPRYAELDARQYHGSAYGMVAAKRGHLKPVGEWNRQTVTVKGSKVTVELNGVVILDADLSTVTEFMGGRPHPGKDRESGHIGFAGHGSAVAFRNPMIKELPDAD